MTAMMNIRNVAFGDVRELNGFVFVYLGDTIEVWSDGVKVDVINFDPAEVTTTLHLEEKAMWWALEYNQI